MPYTDDKRIRDLQSQPTPLLNDVLAMDRAGALEATKITLQQIVNLVGSNTTKQKAYADIVGPDNAFGSNGDFFYRVPLDGSVIQMYQKELGVWNSVFTLPIVGGSPVIRSNSDVQEGTTTSNYINYSVPTGKTIVGIDIVQVISGDTFRKNLNPDYDGTKVYGFDKLTGSDTQTITIKIL